MELVFSHFYVSYGDWLQVVRLVQNRLYSLTHPTNPSFLSCMKTFCLDLGLILTHDETLNDNDKDLFCLTRAHSQIVECKHVFFRVQSHQQPAELFEAKACLSSL